MKPKKSLIRLQLIAILISFFAFSTSFCADEAELPQEIQKLNESYAQEIEQVLPPIQEKYIEALERILENYTKAGSLEKAMQAKKRIESAKRWENLPLAQLRSEEKKGLSRSEFEDWLKTKTFSFRGNLAQITLEFDDKKVRWIVGGKVREYDFKVRGNRSVIVEGDQDFRMEFVDDLSSGTFESNLGEYDLTIVDRK